MQTKNDIQKAVKFFKKSTHAGNSGGIYNVSFFAKQKLREDLSDTMKYFKISGDVDDSDEG
jgi:TPR repeat protein